MEYTDAHYFRRWTLACAAGELLGIGAAGAIAYLHLRWMGEPGTDAARWLNWGVMVLAGCLEGTILGWFQWNTLRLRYPTLPAPHWIGITVLVAALGWAFGMAIPLFWTGDPPAGAVPPPEPSALATYLMASGFGLLIGAVFGLFQWLVLRGYAQRSPRWILANAFGWALGLGFIYLAASLPLAGSSLWISALLGASGGILAGLSVGAVTGRFLLSMPPYLSAVISRITPIS